MNAIDRAVRAINRGGLIVYPTETVYGLGAHALDARAVERVFEVKQRPRDKPVSVAVPSLAAAEELVRVTATTRAFIDRFLPGPVTVICEARSMIPPVVTAGQSRVGIRIPDHEISLALLAKTPPLTATSANVSNGPDVCHPDDLPEEIRSGVDEIIGSGLTPGGPSTVVDVDRGVIHREGPMVDTIRTWLRAESIQADSP